MSEPSTKTLAADGIDAKAETIGRYVLYAPIARGGMATVHIARLVGAEGFSRIVAAKRLHEQYTEDADFVTMFLDEARISSKLHHPNVVSVLDVVLSGKDVVLVQEYVHGVPLDKLVKASQARHERLPANIAVSIVAGTLLGLHSAHETKDELGEPLNIVHRDVSPQNIIVSADGTPRLLDFGIAKARSSAHVTQEGFFKGKITYIPPEQLRGEPPARTTDIYAAGVVLWELLVGRRMHAGRGESELFSVVLSGALPSVEEAAADQREAMGEARWADLVRLNPIVMKALAKTADERFHTADAMAEALRLAVTPAAANELAAWVKELGADFLEARQRVISANEESWRSARKLGSVAPTSVPSVTSGMTSGVQALSGHREPTPSRGAAPTIPDVSYGQPAESTAMKRTWPIILLLLLLVCGLSAFIFMRLGRPIGPAVDPVGSAATLAPTGLAPPSPPPITPPAPDPTPTASVASATATADPNAVPPSTSPKPVAHAPAPRPPPPRPVYHPPAPTPPVPATPAPAATANCNPPYYFEGTKKVFKPGCI